MRQVFWASAGLALALVALGIATLVGVGIGAALTAGGAAGGAGEHELGGEGPDKIVLIRIVGPIVREGGGFGLFGAVASSRRIVGQLDRALNDEAVRAVILELDTPGGSVVASDEVYRKLADLRTARKPVIALMTETAASGGYYIAAGADVIIADPATVTGSIGVIVVLPNFEELNRKIGLRTVVFKSGAFKDMGNPDRAMTPSEAAIFRQLVDEVFERFVGVVAQGRKIPRARVLQLADGRIYTGLQALRLGLVDRTGQMADAVIEARRRAGIQKARVVEYRTGGLLESVLGNTAPRLRVWLGFEPEIGRAPGTSFSLQYLMVP
jgi:protease-4